MLFEKAQKKDEKIEMRVSKDQKDCIKVLMYKAGFTKYSEYFMHLVQQDFERRYEGGSN